MTLRAVKTAISTALMAIAREQASAGDQTLLRALTSGGARYVVEAMSIEPDPLNKCSAAASGRRRKFSNLRIPAVMITQSGTVTNQSSVHDQQRNRIASKALPISS
jgi:hypothetical protein